MILPFKIVNTSGGISSPKQSLKDFKVESLTESKVLTDFSTKNDQMKKKMFLVGRKSQLTRLCNFLRSNQSFLIIITLYRNSKI